MVDGTNFDRPFDPATRPPQAPPIQRPPERPLADPPLSRHGPPSTESTDKNPYTTEFTRPAGSGYAPYQAPKPDSTDDRPKESATAPPDADTTTKAPPPRPDGGSDGASQDRPNGQTGGDRPQATPNGATGSGGGSGDAPSGEKGGDGGVRADPPPRVFRPLIAVGTIMIDPFNGDEIARANALRETSKITDKPKAPADDAAAWAPTVREREEIEAAETKERTTGEESAVIPAPTPEAETTPSAPEPGTPPGEVPQATTPEPPAAETPPPPPEPPPAPEPEPIGKPTAVEDEPPRPPVVDLPEPAPEPAPRPLVLSEPEPATTPPPTEVPTAVEASPEQPADVPPETTGGDTPPSVREVPTTSGPPADFINERGDPTGERPGEPGGPPVEGEFVVKGPDGQYAPAPVTGPPTHGPDVVDAVEIGDDGRPVAAVDGVPSGDSGAIGGTPGVPGQVPVGPDGTPIPGPDYPAGTSDAVGIDEGGRGIDGVGGEVSPGGVPGAGGTGQGEGEGGGEGERPVAYTQPGVGTSIQGMSSRPTAPIIPNAPPTFPPPAPTPVQQPADRQPGGEDGPDDDASGRGPSATAGGPPRIQATGFRQEPLPPAPARSAGETIAKVASTTGKVAAVAGVAIGSGPVAIAKALVSKTRLGAKMGDIIEGKSRLGLTQFTRTVTMPDGTRKPITVWAPDRRTAAVMIRIRTLGMSPNSRRH